MINNDMRSLKTTLQHFTTQTTAEVFKAGQTTTVLPGTDWDPTLGSIISIEAPCKSIRAATRGRASAFEQLEEK